MRIVAGTYKGRRLAAPRGRDVRPTADRVREALFSILGNVDGLCVLDMFAGTGALGLEALSRGAAAATFVELDRHAHEIVQRNIDATVSGTDVETALIKGEASRVIRSLALAERRFDLIFFDPPYDQTAELLEATSDSLPTVCAPGARVVVELAARHRDLVETAATAWGARVELERSYGETVVAVLEVSGQVADDPGAYVESGDAGD